MRTSIRQKLANSKRRILRRLDKTDLRGCSKPILTASNIHYEIAERTRGLSVGGIGAIHALANRLGLPQAIDRRLQLLQLHLPYHESDHVLTFAYLPLCGGTCLQDLELLRHDEVSLRRASEELEGHGYRTHEFGDSVLIEKRSSRSAD